MALELGSFSFLLSFQVKSFKSWNIFLNILECPFCQTVSGTGAFGLFIFYGGFSNHFEAFFSSMPNASVLPARICPSMFNTCGYGFGDHPGDWNGNVTMVN